MSTPWIHALRRNRRLTWLSLAASVVLIGATLGGASASGLPQKTADPSPFHPDFQMLDSNGENVLNSGRPISTMETCGACHDTDLISEHSFHSDAGLASFGSPGSTDGEPWDTSLGLFGKWDPLTYRYLSPVGDPLLDLGTPDWIRTYGLRHVGGGPAMVSREGTPLQSLAADEDNPETAVLDPDSGQPTAWDWRQSGTVEMNCFLCHTPQPNAEARAAALTAGEFAWANTATLLGSQVLADVDGSFAWNGEAFDDEGNVLQSALGLQEPSPENCGLCHGMTDTDVAQPLTFDSCNAAGRRTATTGQVYSPQRIVDSGLNLKDKTSLSRPWDIHAERLVTCTDCHYSLNNPVYAASVDADQPDHLAFDPRRLELGEYLNQPIHEFARGESAQGTIAPELRGTMRRCDSCHDYDSTHDWLPYRERHAQALDCEACHVPALYGGGLQQVDWTVYNDGPVTSCRLTDDPNPTDDTLLQGYQPILLPRQTEDGATRLSTFNLITTWYWVYGEPARPVREVDLRAAWMDGDAYASGVVAAFDQDGDGLLTERELSIRTDEQEQLIAERLMALGLESPTIVGEILPFSINHAVATDEWAVNDCQTCHSDSSRLGQPFQLARWTPAGTMPGFRQDTNVLFPGDLVLASDGSLSFHADTEAIGLYVFGRDAVGWIDWAGALIFVGVLLGVLGHGTLRLVSRNREEPGASTEQVYMYGLYERLWHWLQTFTIVALLLTGLIIHKPEIFSAFHFRYVVLVHNVLAAVLVVNAALALFYHLASGEIRQFIPRPVGFFDQAIVQAKYYLSGIFRGAPHPFEKTPNKKMNPLQQFTYLGILNVLLPLQVLTGLLMWSVQQWPTIAERMGGLPFLAPFHSIVAWLFASFIVAHVYLTTTAGPTPTSSIKAMMLGWEDVETQASEQEGLS